MAKSLIDLMNSLVEETDYSGIEGSLNPTAAEEVALNAFNSLATKEEKSAFLRLAIKDPEFAHMIKNYTYSFNQ